MTQIVKKIAIASPGFYPENSPRSFRATELAQEFVRQGHEVTVITKDRGEASRAFCQKNAIRLKELPPLRWKPVKIQQSRFLNLISRAVSRALLMLFEYPDVELIFRYKEVLAKEEGYDLLISVAVPYPVHWGVALAWRSDLAKWWVADCGDPYMGDESDSFKKFFYFKYVEKWMFRKVSNIAIPIEEARPAYYPEFQNKIVVIPQGLKFEELERQKKANVPQPIPTFGYAGSFIVNKRDPRAFLEHLLSLHIDYRFYIYTSAPGLVVPYARQSNGRIALKQSIARVDLIGELSQMDFLINFNNATQVQLPSKLIDYYIAGRPVLSIPTGETCTTEFQQFLERDYSAQVKMHGYDRYRIENVCAQFLTLIPSGN